MTRRLYPPLGLLEDELFAVPEPVVGAKADGRGEGGEDGTERPAPAPSADLQDLIRRKVASQAAGQPQPLAVGQIRAITRGGAGRALGRTVGVLLGAARGNGLWTGWLVSRESDYATERDLLLEEGDGPCAPEVAMVQCWNRVELRLDGSEALLGRLASRRLGAVMALADRQPDGDACALPRPGRLGLWELDADQVVLTGSPLGGDDDPRHAYQALYRRLAAELAAAAAPVTGEAHRPAGWRAWLISTFVRPAWTFGALAAVLLLLPVLVLLQGGPGPQDESTVYRSLTRREDCEPHARIRLVFRPEAAVADVMQLLRGMELRVVGGPSELGELWVDARDQAAAAEALRLLRASSLIYDAMPVETKGAVECSR